MYGNAKVRKNSFRARDGRKKPTKSGGGGEGAFFLEEDGRAAFVLVPGPLEEDRDLGGGLQAEGGAELVEGLDDVRHRDAQEGVLPLSRCFFTTVMAEPEDGVVGIDREGDGEGVQGRIGARETGEDVQVAAAEPGVGDLHGCIGRIFRDIGSRDGLDDEGVPEAAKVDGDVVRAHDRMRLVGKHHPAGGEDVEVPFVPIDLHRRPVVGGEPAGAEIAGLDA